jgi:hypothetical protein
MRRLFEEMFQRPLSAFLSGAELLDRSISGTRLIDGIISRVVHRLSRSQESGGRLPSQSRLGARQELEDAAVDTRERSSLE